MNNDTAQEMSRGQFAAFVGVLIPNLPKGGFDAQYYIEHSEELKNILHQALVPQPIPAEVCNNVIADWQKFYQDNFDLTVDFSTVQIPNHQKDFDRVIIIPQGLTIRRVVEVIVSKMNLYTWRSDNFVDDSDVPTNDRNPEDGSYAIRIRDRVEADEELRDKSANVLAKKKIVGITLLERLVLELKYFAETGKHLDIDNWTLCSGSRGSDGYVPCVFWCSGAGRLDVGWCFPGSSGGGLRSRAVVS